MATFDRRLEQVVLDAVVNYIRFEQLLLEFYQMTNYPQSPEGRSWLRGIEAAGNAVSLGWQHRRWLRVLQAPKKYGSRIYQKELV
jgi:hypothetical protein